MRPWCRRAARCLPWNHGVFLGFRIGGFRPAGFAYNRGMRDHPALPQAPAIPESFPAGTTPEVLDELLDNVQHALVAHFNLVRQLKVAVRAELEAWDEDQLSDDGALDSLHEQMVGPASETGVLEPAWQAKWFRCSGALGALGTVLEDWATVSKRFSTTDTEILALEDALSAIVTEEVLVVRVGWVTPCRRAC